MLPLYFTNVPWILRCIVFIPVRQKDRRVQEPTLFGLWISSCCLFKRSELNWRKNAFKFAAFFIWSELQKDLELNELVSLDAFKKMLDDRRQTHLAVDVKPDIFLVVDNFV